MYRVQSQLKGVDSFLLLEECQVLDPGYHQAWRQVPLYNESSPQLPNGFLITFA